MKRIAIMGAGSLGTIIGAMMTKNGIDVTLVDANKAHVDMLNQVGATVTGSLDLKGIPVKAITPDKLDGIYDIVYILTKQLANVPVSKSLLPHLSDESVICTLQNGIPEENLNALYGKERVIGGAVGWGATWEAPGISRMTSALSSMKYDIGEQEGDITPRVREVAEILGNAGDVVMVTNLAGIKWTKLIQNAAMSGMSAALGCEWSAILDDDKATKAAAYIGDECIRVVRKREILLENIVEDWSYYSLEFHDSHSLNSAMSWIRKYFEPHRKLKASMLQDMEKGIPCEIDYIVGPICEWGKKFGILTPICQTVVDIVHEFEAGKIPFPDMSLLDRFEFYPIRSSMY
ncbi:ketopantoate reductase family protein [Lachnospiraceae bacterium ZAX-1]